MKKWLLWWKNYWGKGYCIFWGCLFILCDITFIFIAVSIDELQGFYCFILLLFLLATWFTLAAAFTEEDPPSYITVDDLAKKNYLESKPNKYKALQPKYITLDDQGNPIIVSAEDTLETGKRFDIQVNGKKEAQDTLGMIETLFRIDKISEEDYIRVKNQLTEYLKSLEGKQDNFTNTDK